MTGLILCDLAPMNESKYRLKIGLQKGGKDGKKAIYDRADYYQAA